MFREVKTNPGPFKSPEEKGKKGILKTPSAKSLPAVRPQEEEEEEVEEVEEEEDGEGEGVVVQRKPHDDAVIHTMMTKMITHVEGEAKNRLHAVRLREESRPQKSDGLTRPFLGDTNSNGKNS